ncbi:MAG: 2,3-bisphosphoglycerate-independent phosphoglycerate mutase [Candidatus Heimdallarchaeum aukensis]|uniref:2,3-bisphosphoglycerate-independent phosphoglycerate mutase n=1 Tax=Candidatus Heimdallarchaeum aukensis TaxID=2876573 RepID=A0A9Y1BIL6_9ARCH|nr:MAG: 2,3-bisphosphoglycerate-independent phosphoglycerate mutase [Candidatus Heimdallarchaeum aukensis]
MTGKLLFIILDGLGDRPIPELDGKTPLEYAKTPNMDKFAELGVTGIMDVIETGQTPGSDTAHLALFGVDPFQYYTGRGPFEASGVGLTVKEGDIAFRVNFATMDEKGIIIDRRAGRIKEGTEEFIKQLNGMKIEDVQFLMKAGTEHRAALVLRGENLSDKVSANDPKVEGKAPYSFKALDDSESAQKTARVLSEFARKSHEILSHSPLNEQRIEAGKLPANYLLIRGAGRVPKLPNFEKEYGLQTACVAGGGLYKGVARMLGMEIVEKDGMTGGTNTDVRLKAETAFNLLKTHDFIFLHFKGTDNYGHDGNYNGKVEFIEKVDKELYRFLPENFDEELVVMISGDHSTPCSFKDHSADPVPLIVYSPTCVKDNVKYFGERYAYNGGLGRIKGKHLMKVLLNELHLVEKFGA